MPNLTNYHSHCLYCDGRANMEDFIRFAISAGFTFLWYFVSRSTAIFYRMDNGMGSDG